MTTNAIKASAVGSTILPAVFALILGLGVVTVTGHALLPFRLMSQRYLKRLSQIQVF